MDVKKRYQSKFRTKSSMEADYGKKLKQGRGSGVPDSKDVRRRVQAKRATDAIADVYGENVTRVKYKNGAYTRRNGASVRGRNNRAARTGRIIGAGGRTVYPSATDQTRTTDYGRASDYSRITAYTRGSDYTRSTDYDSATANQVLQGRRESEELLGIKAQMAQQEKFIHQQDDARHMAEETAHVGQEAYDKVHFVNRDAAEKASIADKFRISNPKERASAMSRATDTLGKSVGTVSGAVTEVVGSSYSDGGEDNNPADDAIGTAGWAAYEADRWFKDSYNKDRKEEYKKEKKHSNEQNPMDGSNARSREWQKKRTRKSYYEREKEREAAKGGLTRLEDIANKLSEKISDIFTALISFVEENPKLLILIIVIALLIIMLCTLLSSCMMIMPAMNDGGATSSFSAYDEDITGVEKDYRKLEEDLDDTITKTPELYPGYDEYEYELDEIGHDPYELAAYLTAKYDDYKRKNMKTIIKELFKKQYKLTYTARLENRTLTWTNPDGSPGRYDYTVKILKVKLENKGLNEVIKHLPMTEKQRKHYELLKYTYGNKDYLFDDVYGDGDEEEYHVPGEALTDQQFAAMIAEAEKYLGRAYVWGGSNPTTGFDCSGFVCWVINHCGWHVGRTTAQGLRKYCTEISPGEVKPGDLIFFERTYNTSGASHVGIYVGDGMMIHCGNPIGYASVNTKYWREHFLCYGRLPATH